MKETINILFSCDSGYAMPLTVSATSIFENHKEDNVIIYVFYSTLTDNQKEKLYLLAKTYNQTVELIHVDEHYFKDAPILRWSKETYYRLLIHELLTEKVKKILYLDCDIIINKNIRDLYNIDLKDKYIAALPEKQSFSYRERLKLNQDGQYFQAGVILFDLVKTKNILNYNNALLTIDNIGQDMLAVDQDVMNVMFDGKIYSLDKKYNNTEITNFNNSIVNRLFNKINTKELSDTCVLHYATGKPWNNLYSGSCEEFWYFYLNKSPYNYLYKTKYNKLKYKILRTSFTKTVFYLYIRLTPYINNAFKKVLSKERYLILKNIYRKYIK